MYQVSELKLLRWFRQLELFLRQTKPTNIFTQTTLRDHVGLAFIIRIFYRTNKNYLYFQQQQQRVSVKAIHVYQPMLLVHFERPIK